jgi:hypothetical protein
MMRDVLGGGVGAGEQARRKRKEGTSKMYCVFRKRRDMRDIIQAGL